MLGGSRTQPVTDLEVGDHATSHRQGGADHTTNHHRCHDATCAIQTDSDEDAAGDDQGHQGHTAHRVATHDSDSVGRHRSEQESDDNNNNKCHDGLHQVVDDTEIEEHEGHQQCGCQCEHQNLHGDVALCALDLGLVLGVSTEGLTSQTGSTLDDAPRLDDAQDTAHGDATDADVTRIVLEDVIGRQRGHVGTVCSKQRHNNPPDECTTGKDDECVAQADDVAQTQHSRSSIDLEEHLGVVGQRLQGRNGCGREHLFPPAEGADDEVVQTAHQTGDEQRLGLRATLLATDEHLCGSRSLGEGELAMLLAHEVLAEGDEEQQSQQSAQHRAKEDLQEVNRDLGILGLQDVKCGQCKD